MCKFGISFSGDFSDMLMCPNGFVPIEIRLGETLERAFCDLSVWSMDDYRKHWKETCKQLMFDDTFGLFCSSMSRRDADIWLARKVGDQVLLFNSITHRRELVIDGYIIRFKTGFEEFFKDASPDWSHWELPLGYLKCFAAH